MSRRAPAWAKERLTVADLNLVKRYLDVFEQIKFRCEKIVALVEPEEKDDDDDDDDAAGGALPPLPERKGPQPVKSSATPAASPETPASPESSADASHSRDQSNSAAKAAKAPLGRRQISAPLRSALTRVAPAR